MMNTALALVVAKALPALSGSSLTYNPEKNVYLTLGYTSTAGNTYYRVSLTVWQFSTTSGKAMLTLSSMASHYLHGTDRRQTLLLRSSGAVATGDASTNEAPRKRAFSC